MNRPHDTLASSQHIVRRPRRLRLSAGLRGLRREHHLRVDQLVQPVFFADDASHAGPIASMPGIRRLRVTDAASEAHRLRAAGVTAALVFGVPATKDDEGTRAADPDGVVPRAVRAMRDAVPDLVLVTDLCLCAYTTHGHCGAIDGGRVLNDVSNDLLARAALAHAAAGADLVAPSCMFDGIVGAVRTALDDAGFEDTGILSYAVKYASSFYGPFRDAAGSAPAFGDRRTHQMDPANASEAMLEATLDVDQGADILMVKPALPSLDIVRRLRERFEGIPIAAYQVSGEYAALVAAAERGWLDLRATALESLLAIRRAGADVIVSYFADRAARWLHEAETGR
ncbi:MAG: porphobilinogen synthase [Phycisphaerales bacterium]